MTFINPQSNLAGIQSRQAHWKRMQAFSRNSGLGQFCAQWLPGQRFDGTADDRLALNFNEGCILLFRDYNNNEECIESAYINLTAEEILDRVNAALGLASKKKLEIPGLPQKAIEVILNKLRFVKGDLEKCFSQRIISRDQTLFDFFQQELPPDDIQVTLGSAILAKRIIECNT